MVTTKLFTTEGGAQSRVGAAIHTAASRTGVAFDYLLNQAKVESGLNPTARARTSSATGLFQFIDQTWLATVHKHGAAHGLGWAAGQIEQGRDGRYRVSDSGVRRQILDLRNNPEAASAMAAEFASDNASALESTLGRTPEAVDLYLAHFLGAGGAATFLRAHDANPDAPAASLLPSAARANRPIFFARDGSPRSLGEIRQRFAAKIGGDPALPPVASEPGLVPGEFIPLRMAALEPGVAPSPRAVSPQYERLAYLMLAELGG